MMILYHLKHQTDSQSLREHLTSMINLEADDSNEVPEMKYMYYKSHHPEFSYAPSP